MEIVDHERKINRWQISVCGKNGHTADMKFSGNNELDDKNRSSKLGQVKKRKMKVKKNGHENRLGRNCVREGMHGNRAMKNVGLN